MNPHVDFPDLPRILSHARCMVNLVANHIGTVHEIQHYLCRNIVLTYVKDCFVKYKTNLRSRSGSIQYRNLNFNKILNLYINSQFKIRKKSGN